MKTSEKAQNERKKKKKEITIITEKQQKKKKKLQKHRDSCTLVSMVSWLDWH